MKQQFKIVLISATTALLAGCTSTETPPQNHPERMTEAELPAAQAAAERYVTGLAEALRTGEFAALAAVFPENAERNMPEEYFINMRKGLLKKYGELAKVTYLGELDNTLVRDYYWKFTFHKVIPPTGKGEESPGYQRHEVLYLVRMGQLEGKFVQVGTGFM